ncbi:MAG: hypothetical protein NTY63_03360 [Candidatus Bipolaricaulota bacterium]|nr:hypothetical protein [Candidatus Bipolaricaulota bacterium]
MTRPIAFRGPRSTWHGGPEARLAEMKAGFAQARDRRPDEFVETWVVLAGMSVRLQVVGRDLADALGMALRHLVVARGDGRVPDLAIAAWDERISEIAAPADAGSLWTTDEGGVILGDAEDRTVGHIRDGVELWLERDAAGLWGSARDGTNIGLQNRGKPFHAPLLVWHADHDVPVMHGALVGCDGAGLLLVGQGGTGKTTAAMACFLDGFDFLGDDYIAIEEPATRTYVGHSLYDSVWLTRDGEARLPGLAQYAEPPIPTGAPKRLVHAAAVHPERTPRAVRIRGVVCTALADGAAPAISPTTGAKALLAMAPTSTLRLPVTGARLMDRMAAVAETLPCYELRVGGDLASLPGLLRGVLESGDRT